MSKSVYAKEFAILHSFLLNERANRFRYGQKDAVRREMKVAEIDRVRIALERLKTPEVAALPFYHLVGDFIEQECVIRRAKWQKSGRAMWWHKKLMGALDAKASFKRLEPLYQPYLIEAASRHRGQGG